MQPDFFESDIDSRVRCLNQRKDQLLDQLKQIHGELGDAFRQSRSYQINSEGTLRLLRTHSNSIYLDIMDKRGNHSVAAIDMQLLESAVINMQKDLYAADIK